MLFINLQNKGGKMSKKIIFGIGAVFSGIFASICCLGPVILALFGLSFAGFAQLHKYRPFFVILSLVFLGAAFYFVYRKKEVKCADGTCQIESSNKTTKIMLWIITAIVLGVISFLWW